MCFDLFSNEIIYAKHWKLPVNKHKWIRGRSSFVSSFGKSILGIDLGNFFFCSLPFDYVGLARSVASIKMAERWCSIANDISPGRGLISVHSPFWWFDHLVMGIWASMLCMCLCMCAFCVCLFLCLIPCMQTWDENFGEKIGGVDATATLSVFNSWLKLK